MKHIQFIQKSILLTVILSFFNTVNAQDTIVFSAQAIEPTQLSKAVPITSAGVGEPVYFAFSFSSSELRKPQGAEIFVVALNFDITGLKISPQAIFPVKMTESKKGIYVVSEEKNGRLYGKGVLVPQTGESPEYYNSPYYYNSNVVNNDFYNSLDSYCTSDVSDKKRIANVKLIKYELDFFDAKTKQGTGGPVVVETPNFEAIAIQLPSSSTYQLINKLETQREANYKITSEKVLQNAPAHPDYYINNYDPEITGVSRKEIETLIIRKYKNNDPNFKVINLGNPTEVRTDKNDYGQISGKTFEVDYLAQNSSGKCTYATLVLTAPYLINGSFGPYEIFMGGYKPCSCTE